MALEGKTPVYQLQGAGNLQEGEANPMRLLNPDGSAVESIGGANVVLSLGFSGASDPSVNVIKNTTASNVTAARSSAGVYSVIFDSGTLGINPSVLSNFASTTSGTILRVNALVPTDSVILRNYDSSFAETDLPIFSRVIVSIWIN